MSTISEVVKLSPGYKSAVNVEHDMDNYEKISAYIPTEVGSKCLELVSKALNIECKERAFLITGTYGTGKSHLAICLSHFFKNRGLDSHLNPVMDKINNKWPDRYEMIRKYRTEIEDKPFVVVTLYQDEGRINDALIRKLDETLSSLGLHDLLPDTVFTASLKRIEDIRLNHPDALNAFKKIIDEEGLVSIEDFERRLKNYEKEAFKIFERIHPRFSHGAQFKHNQDIKAPAVYVSTAKKLKEKSFAGIVVLWDEFGRYLERSMDDPKGDESLELQEFAEACNDSYLLKEEIKLFTFLIAHKEMQEYLGLVNAKMAHLRSDEEKKALQSDIQKIQKRFHSEIRMKSNDTEIFDLIDHVILQQKKTPLWNTIVVKDVLGIWTDKCVDAKIFPEFGKTTILETVVEGSYPLHPVTTCCLPKLSEKVAQNERTLFQFLCKDEPNSVFEFMKQPIEDRNGKLNVITIDRLTDYFKEEIRKCDREQIKKKWREYHQAEGLLTSSPDIHKRIAKAIAILNMASDEERIKLNTTPEFIAFCLNERLEDVSTALEIMSSRDSQEKILAKNNVDGTYRFYGAGVIDPDEEIERIVKERVSIINPIKLLDRSETTEEDKLWDKLDLPGYIEPKSYNDDYRMNRVINLKPVDTKRLEAFRGMTNDGIQDGLLFLVLCESESEIKNAVELINGDSFKEPRILVAMLKQPVIFSHLVSRYDALNRLSFDKKEMFGAGANFEDEWLYRYNECIELLKKIFQPLLNPEKNLLDFYWLGEIKKGITSRTKLEALASEMMRAAYPFTPLVLREELKKTEGNDTFKKHRKPVIDHLLREDGPQSLAKEVNAPVKSVIELVLKINHILVRKQGDWIIEKPADIESISKVWDTIETFILSCRMPGKPASHLIQLLLSPPFGIRRRSIPVILAAVLRKYILRGNIAFKERELSINKIDSEVIEAIVANPERYTIIYAEIGEGQKAIVEGTCWAFEIETYGDLGDRLVALRDKIVSWWQALPNYARKTTNVSGEAKVMRAKVFMPISVEGADIRRIFFENLPESVGLDDLGGISCEQIVEKIYRNAGSVKKEFEMATDNLKSKILDSFKEVFGGNTDKNTIESITDWHKDLNEKGDLITNGDTGRLLKACRKLREEKNGDILLDLVSEITGSRSEDWVSINVLDELRGQLKNIKKTVEEYNDTMEIPECRGISPTDKDQIVITLLVDCKKITRQFKKTTEISQIGRSMANLINEAIKSLAPALSEEEKFTVLIEVLKEHLG